MGNAVTYEIVPSVLVNDSTQSLRMFHTIYEYHIY